MADKLGKVNKRKRHTDGSSQPSKKVAIEAGKSIKFSFQNAEKWAPVIASTPGLALPPKIPLEPCTKPRNNAPQRAGRSGAIATTELLLHSSAHPKVDYIAREEEAGGTDSLLKHYVGVYDPETGKLEVVEARKMVVRGSLREHQATSDDEISTNMREQRNELGQVFGTKKAKKAIASVSTNAIGPARSARDEKAMRLDPGAAAVIASMAEATAGMATREQLREEADAAKPRPKANLKTKEIREVYTIENLIGMEMFKHVPILDWVQSVKENKNIEGLSSSFVAKRIIPLASMAEKLKLLRYLYMLLVFYNLSKPVRGVRQLPKREEVRNALDPLPEVLIESVKRKFTDGGVMGKFKVDLLITHCCVLACLVDNYEVDMLELRLDLKLETKPMSQYFKEIGARIGGLGEQSRKVLGLDKATAAQRQVARLKIPLSFPQIAFARKAR